MPRYFFDWEVLDMREKDRRGMKLQDLATAIEVATDCAAELVAEDILRGDAESAGTILVRDSDGRILHQITLEEARLLTALRSIRPN